MSKSKFKKKRKRKKLVQIIFLKNKKMKIFSKIMRFLITYKPQLKSSIHYIIKIKRYKINYKM